MDIFYVDLVLLTILCILTLVMCGYGFYCVYTLVVAIRTRMPLYLRPTKVLYSLQKEDLAHEELRTVVAYQNPFTGDYCVHKSRPAPRGYVNSLPQSPGSGMSDEYEPLSLEPQPAQRRSDGDQDVVKPVQQLAVGDNSVNKSWNWNYKEYQI